MGVDELIDKLTIEVAPNDILVEKLQEMYEAANVLIESGDLKTSGKGNNHYGCQKRLMEFTPGHKRIKVSSSYFLFDTVNEIWWSGTMLCRTLREIPPNEKVTEYYDFNGKSYIIWKFVLLCDGAASPQKQPLSYSLFD